ncbi:aspartate/glutamate racemase family protein [Phytohabitans suffuscus]
MRRLLVINPLGTDYHDAETVELLAGQLPAGVTVTVDSLRDGVPATAFLPLPSTSYNQLIGRVIAAEREGFDAVVIACASDPTLATVKPLVGIPVTAPMEAALHTAAALGGRLGIVAPRMRSGENEKQPQTANWVRELVQQYGMWHRVATIRSAAVTRPPDAEVERLFAEDPEKLRVLVRDGMAAAAAGPGLDHARAAVERDEATVLFFACTTWGGLLGPVRDAVSVRVLDPVVDTVRFAALLAGAGLRSPSLTPPTLS